MQKFRNLLILTASYGDGHLQVSRVLKQKFEQYGFRSIRMIDLFEEAHPLLNKVTRFLYMNSGALSAYGLDYYGWSYYLTRDMKPDSLLARCLNVLGIQKLMKVILKEEPDMIISTFPFGGISEQLKRRGISIPTFTIVTDFALHNRWLYSIPDQFFVATEHLRQKMIERGIPEHIITVSGIPIRDTFYMADPETEEHAVAERAVLVMAGAYGVLRDLKKMIEQLLYLPGVHIHVVCGKNQKLKGELEAGFAQESRVRLYGFVEQIHELMKRSSCVITKAGGITLSEAIHVNVPIVVFKPFPGQEKENAGYLSEQGIVFIANNLTELIRYADALTSDHELRRTVKEKTCSLQAGYAAERIVSDVLHMLKGRTQVQTHKGSSA
ncbi:processive 1,2-diacylglycerol beta-glucosyltransferase [Paenibacillus sp. UNCCL117]|uniref:MGDG synthase family glycosyltransferase n=1 Tax=unclassified Paenibacillus TaxID=185978 RepID=UPI0008813E06|nr:MULTISPECIES: glycosyltransferase [unclassified Paenibacillus]SDC05968.1 processive 1,2-diacylglycerol beta-glucosyltransferase [Paenibacillus sp. cl123]SFW37695.1 processive 1,2-diacylglycerol beta-glucosyltransferase [Paenibacillus sp. UNCCL117]